MQPGITVLREVGRRSEEFGGGEGKSKPSQLRRTLVAGRPHQVERKVEIKNHCERAARPTAQLKAGVRLAQLRGTSGAVGIVADAVEQSDDSQDSAPPYAGVQVVENYFDRGRMGNLVKSRAEDQHAIDQQRNAYEKPDGNCSVRSHQPHQNIILSAMKTIATITAQNAGFWYIGTAVSEGISVAP